MKKAIMCFIGAMMILSLAACTPTTEKNKTGEVKQTEAAKSGTATSQTDGVKKNSVDYNKAADPTAPKLNVVSIYTVSEDGSKLEGTMDALDELNPQTLTDLMIQYGVLEEGTEVIEFRAEGEPASKEVGPGTITRPGVVFESNLREYGTLNVNKLPDGGKDDMVIKAIANTFIENMDVVYLTIQVNGETVVSNMSVEDIK